MGDRSPRSSENAAAISLQVVYTHTRTANHHRELHLAKPKRAISVPGKPQGRRTWIAPLMVAEVSLAKSLQGPLESQGSPPRGARGRGRTGSPGSLQCLTALGFKSAIPQSGLLTLVWYTEFESYMASIRNVTLFQTGIRRPQYGITHLQLREARRVLTSWVGVFRTGSSSLYCFQAPSETLQGLIYVHIHIYFSLCMYTYMHIHTCVYTYIRVYVRTYTCICMYLCLSVCAC